MPLTLMPLSQIQTLMADVVSRNERDFATLSTIFIRSLRFFVKPVKRDDLLSVRISAHLRVDSKLPDQDVNHLDLKLDQAFAETLEEIGSGVYLRPVLVHDPSGPSPLSPSDIENINKEMEDISDGKDESGAYFKIPVEGFAPRPKPSVDDWSVNGLGTMPPPPP